MPDRAVTTGRRGEAARRRSSRTVIDGLLVGRSEVWAVVAGSSEELRDLLTLDGEGAPIRICRGMLDGERLILGTVDPESDPFLSELLREEPGGEV